MYVTEKARTAVLALTVAGMLAAENAMAAVPAIVGTTVTTLQADAVDIFDTVFPFVAAVLGLIIVMKLFKRFVSKA